jgi:hypothetical protein
MSSLLDAALLAELAPTFGHEAGEAAALLRRPAAIRQDEWVGAAAPQLLPIAESYARSTGRRAALAEDPIRAARDPNFSVLVTETGRVAPELLEGLFSEPALWARRCAPGLVFADAGPEAKRSALQYALAMRLSAESAPGRRVALFPLDDVGLVQGEDGSVLAGAGHFDRLAGELRGSAIALLSVTTHSDGIDIFLGPGLVACGWNSWGDTATPGAMPRCLIQRHCHRLDMPIAESGLADRLVNPARWRARVLFLDVCFGLMATDLIDRRYGLLCALAAGGRVGAIVTNFELSFTGVDFSEMVSEALCSGRPIGTALRELTCTPAARRLNRRFALIGDPALTCPVVVPRLLPASEGAAMPASVADPEIGALRYCLHVAGETELALASPSLKRDEALVAWLCQRGKIFDLWARLSRISRGSAQFDCALCDRRGEVFRSGLEAPHIARELLVCIACGAVADRPAGDETLMAPSWPSGFRLLGVPERPVRRAVLQLWGGDAEYSAHCDWPISASGVPAPFYTWQKPWPAGPLRANIFLFHGDELSVASAMVSRSGGSPPPRSGTTVFGAAVRAGPTPLT